MTKLHSEVRAGVWTAWSKLDMCASLRSPLLSRLQQCNRLAPAHEIDRSSNLRRSFWACASEEVHTAFRERGADQILARTDAPSLLGISLQTSLRNSVYSRG